jgi:hypothetical protein
MAQIVKADVRKLGLSEYPLEIVKQVRWVNRSAYAGREHKTSIIPRRSRRKPVH